MNRIYFGNSIKAWLVALAIGFVVYLALVLLKRLAVSRLGNLAEKTDTDFDDAVVEVVRNTRGFFLLAVAIYAGIRGLDINPRLLRAIERFLELSFLLQVGLWASGLVAFMVKRSLEKREQSSDRIGVAAVRAIGVAVKVIAWIIIVLLAIQFVFGKNITTLLTVGSIGGVALALAVQNILGDLLAAVAIVFDRPFDVGDTIQVDQLVGKVEQIGLKTTRLRSASGEQLIMGNGDLLKSRLRNYKRMYERQKVLHLDLRQDTPPELIERLPAAIRQIVESQKSIRFERAHFSTFTDSALRIEVVYFVLDPDYQLFMDTQQAINLALLRRFAADGIQFAYPTRTVQLHGEGPFSVRPSAEPAK